MTNEAGQMMEWTDVQVDLPKDGEEVLVFVGGSGQFGTFNDPLCTKTTHRIFQGALYRQRGWDIPFCPPDVRVKYWMPKPEDPVWE